MSDESELSPQPDISGRMFLYEQPELLTAEAHAGLGLTPPERPFEHLKSVTAIPLTMIEFSSAQKNYPIVFSGREQPIPLAIVGLHDQVNLFVDHEGKWDPLCYVPTYLRCYPIAFAKDEGGRKMLVVDRAADSITTEPEFPFFVDGEPSEYTNSLMQLCSAYEKEWRLTQAFCAKLVELDLLALQEASYTEEGSSAEKQVIANYVCIDAQKLTEIERDVLYELHREGLLSAMYLHLYSLQNWRDLMLRGATRTADS